MVRIQFEGQSWTRWRPSKRYHLWRYRSESPPLVSLILREKTLDLNQTASIIWDSIDGKLPIVRIMEVLGERHPDVSRKDLLRDVMRTLLFFEQEKLIYLLWEPLR